MIERRKNIYQQLLIVDDDISYCEILNHALKQVRCKISTVHNGEDCLSITKREFFKVCLLDNILKSNEKGVDLIPHIQQISPATKIILMSAFANLEDKLYALNCCAGYIDKPSDILQLVLKVKSVLGEG